MSITRKVSNAMRSLCFALPRHIYPSYLLIIWVLNMPQRVKKCRTRFIPVRKGNIDAFKLFIISRDISQLRMNNCNLLFQHNLGSDMLHLPPASG